MMGRKPFVIKATVTEELMSNFEQDNLTDTVNIVPTVCVETRKENIIAIY